MKRIGVLFQLECVDCSFFIFERIGVLMQRWRIIVVIGGWMVVALMRIRFTEQVWFGRMTNMWTDLDEDREQERMGYKNKISSDQETGNGIYNNTVMVKKEILKPLFTALLQLQSCSAFLPRTELSWEGQSHDSSYLPRKDELLYTVEINLLPTKNGYILQEDRKEA